MAVSKELFSDEVGNELILIQHGFMGASSRYSYMKDYFLKKGYKLINYQITTTGRPLDSIYQEFEERVHNVPFSKFKKVHWIGHSLGCVLMRMYLSNHDIPNLKNIIFIAGPNSNLEFKSGIYFKLGQTLSIFRPLQDLRKIYKDIPPIKNKSIKIGIISGTKSNLPTAKDVDPPSDGLLNVSMTKLDKDRMDDELVVPYNHFEIYQKLDVIEHIDNFIKQSKFE